MFDNSPRRLYGNKPKNIVIAVTDGQDNSCGSGYYSDHFRRTRNAATKLKGADYEAFFMSIGVGITSPSSYYYQRLQEIASDMGGGAKAYFPVTSYNEIKDAVGTVFKPLCEQFHTECGLECKGFCGCGECMCPFCDVTGDKCEDYQCEARAGTSDGCVLTPLITCPEDDWCTQYVCDATNGSAECKELHTCDEYVSKNPGSCRTVTCDKNGTKCVVKSDDNVCKQLDTACVKWECAGENVTATDEATGCIVKENKTAICQSEGEAACLEYTCSLANGTCIVKHDTCEDQNDGCTTFKCEKSGTGSEYGCVEHPIEGPANTSCATYTCDPDPDIGWHLFNSTTDKDCRGNDPDVCKLYKCYPSKGCDYEFVDPCDEKCTEAFVGTCQVEANLSSTLDSCLLAACKVRTEGSSPDTVPYCVNYSTNCLTSELAEDAQKKNGEDPKTCYTVECANGTCVLTKRPNPTEENTACWLNVCRFINNTHGWDWVREPTEVQLSCKSDVCNEWKCDDKDGCVPTDICGVKSNDCKTYFCKTNDDGSKECTYKNKTLIDAECMYEECIGDVKHQWPKNVTEVCVNSNKCKVPACSEKGLCVYKDATPPEGLFTNDQLECAVCDPDTGSWSFGCDDGLFCTNDICAVGGKCRHTDVNCFKILNMSANSEKDKCFMAVCNERSDKYQCKRKKKVGVYVDVCGNCIRQDGYEGSSGESEDDTVACVEAPEEPVLKEPLAAAAIAMIVLLAVLVGGVIAASTIIGTKTLLERARAANNQSAHSNPLFEDNVKEVSNPTFMEEVEVEAP